MASRSWRPGLEPEQPSFLLPLEPPRTGVLITGPFPLSRENWRRMMHLLETMEPGLVADDDGEGS